MSTIIKQQYGKKIDATGAIQIFHFETDSDMVLIEGEAGVTLSQKLTALVANRTISLSGGVTGSATYNGVDSVSIDVEVGDDSHEHTGATIKVGAAGRVVITGEDESLNVSSISETELGYLSGVTSSIQQQLNAKASGDHNHDAVYLKQILLGANSGIAPLDENGKILAQYLPSYVDDVIEGTVSEDLTTFTNTDGEVVTPEAGKLYNDTTANQIYRWGGTVYAAVGGAGGGVALGETASTAYRGDRGKIAYDHSQTAHAPSNATVVTASDTNGNVIINGTEVIVYTHPSHTARSAGLYKITVDAHGHVTAVTAVSKADITGLGIPGAATTLSDLGITATAAELNYVDGVTSAIQTQLDGKAAASHGTHVTFSTTAPKVAGTAAVGTATTVSRSDHVHPAQTTVSGNAGTATKFAAAQSIALTGDVTGSVSSQAGWSIETALKASGVTAGSYGPSANASPAHAGTFSVPYFTVDAKGRVTAAATRTITLPSDNNTDTKNTAGSSNTSSKIFLVGATSQAANPVTYSHDTVYVGTDGCLYSNSTRVVNIATGSTQPTNQLAGDLWFETIS